MTLKTWGGYTLVDIDPTNVKKGIKQYYDLGLDGISIRSTQRDLNFLEDCPDIKGILLLYPEEIDISGLQHIKDITFLAIGKHKFELDLSSYKSIKDLTVNWTKKVRLPQTDSLNRLYIEGYNPTCGDLSELVSYSSLIALELVRSSIKTLKGIEKLISLKSAQFVYFNKLEVVASLTGSSIEELEFESCKKISDFSAVSTMENLRKLHYTKCGSLPTIDFISTMNKLEEFTFVGTEIDDGNMLPLLKLKWAGFFNKKHYSHTFEQIEKLIKQRTAEID